MKHNKPDPTCTCGHNRSEHASDGCTCYDYDDESDDELPCSCRTFHPTKRKQLVMKKIQPKKTLPAVKVAMEAVKDKTKQGKKPKKQVMVYLYEVRIDMDELSNVKDDLDTTIDDLKGYGAVNLIDSGIVEGEI